MKPAVTAVSTKQKTSINNMHVKSIFFSTKEEALSFFSSLSFFFFSLRMICYMIAFCLLCTCTQKRIPLQRPSLAAVTCATRIIVRDRHDGRKPPLLSMDIVCTAAIATTIAPKHPNAIKKHALHNATFPPQPCYFFVSSPHTRNQHVKPNHTAKR